MYNLFMILGILILFVGTFSAVVTTIVFAVKRKKVKTPLLCIPICLIVGIILLVIGSIMYGKTDEYKQYMEQKAKEEKTIEDQNSEETEKTEETEIAKDKTEEAETESSDKIQTETENKIENRETETNKETEIKEPESEETEQKEDTETNSETEETVSAGYSFEAKGFKITINETNVDFTDYDNEYGLNTPQSGMKYVMASFTFENTNKMDNYVSIYDFECYADGELCEQVYGLDDSDFINANLSSGRKVSFKTYYSVPINAKTIDLEYETNFWTDKKEIIKIQ